MFTLENDCLRVRVDAVGAELTSLYSKQTQREYLWQPGYETWPHHSMLLFPNPGRIAHDRVLIGGREYPASMHGFANDMTFSVLEHSTWELVLELRATEQTLQVYPYLFRLQVRFCLEGDRLMQSFTVYNDGAQPLYYCLGAHPGFYCPIALGSSAESHSLVFSAPQQLYREVLQENTRLLTGKQSLYLDGEAVIPLCDRFFDGGPLLFSGMKAETLTLRCAETGDFVELGVADFPNLCLWGVPAQMSIIAIEPWIGTSDRWDTDHIWEKKPGAQCVLPEQKRTHTLTFRAGREN